MKNIKKLPILLILLCLVITSGCNGDDDTVEISLENLELSLNENPAADFVIGTIQSSSSIEQVFEIVSQTPGGAMNIDQNTGTLSVANPALFDFEVNPVLTATISSDQATNTAIVTVNLTNIAEVSAQDFSVTIDENPTSGQSLGAVQASGDGTLSFSINSQTPANALAIAQGTGELSVSDPSLFDYETNPVITATISVNNAGAIETVNATINLSNVNELSIEDFTATVGENPAVDEVVGTVEASGDGSLVFSISTQSPAGALSIDASTGELKVASAAIFDFETHTSVTATVMVDNSVSTETASVTITIANKHEVGEFAFGGVIFWVNADGDQGLVCTISDLNGGNAVTWNNGTNIGTGATASAIGTGQANTTAIVNAQGAGTYAASLCDDLTLNSFSDWYLPSIDELTEMYVNRAIINATAVANGGSNFSVLTWSSTEQTGNVNNAFIWIFADSQVETLNAKANSAHVRAVRSWTDF